VARGWGILRHHGITSGSLIIDDPDHPHYPTKAPLALRVLETFKAQPPEVRIHSVMADALYGTAPFVDGAAALVSGVQVISPIRKSEHAGRHA
jgi:hypothetical protein